MSVAFATPFPETRTSEEVESLLSLRVESEPWMDEARCAGVDPDLFFPDRTNSTRPAKEICHQCPVEDACLDYALRTGQKHGIWGGTSERERRRIRRRRAQGL